MVTLDEIRKRLIESIKQSKLTITELAQKVNIKYQSLQQYLTGRAMPSLDTLANLCLVLDVSPNYILCFSNDI